MEFNDNKPIYLQLADSIMDAIMRGDLTEESRMPSVRDYAVNTGVNPNTVMRTFTWLQNQNFIYNKRGIGYFISPSAKDCIREMRRKHFFENEAGHFFRRLASFGVSPEQLKTDYNAYLKSSVE